MNDNQIAWKHYSANGLLADIKQGLDELRVAIDVELDKTGKQLEALSKVVEMQVVAEETKGSGRETLNQQKEKHQVQVGRR